MKKGLYSLLLLAMAICLYFVLQPQLHLPAGLEGTAADPRMFMSAEAIDQTHRYGTLRYMYSFLLPLFQFAILMLFIHLYRSDRLVLWKGRRGSVIIHTTIIYLLFRLVQLPVSAAWQALRRYYSLSSQPYGSWLTDRLLDIGVGVVTELPVLLFIYVLLRKYPRRGWLLLWATSVPVIVFSVLLQPVVIDPLFNTFQPVQNIHVREEVLNLAEEAGVPITNVREVNMSKQSNTVNAYVNGIGTTAQIVIWDTSYSRLTTDELLSMVAHEIGHYKHKDVYKGTIIGIVGSFLFFWVLWLTWRRLGSLGLVNGSHSADNSSIRSITTLMLLLLFFLFLSNPINSAFSRRMEISADRYATALTGNLDANIRLHQKLAIYNKSEMHPPLLYRFFYGTHPTLAERIREDLLP